MFVFIVYGLHVFFSDLIVPQSTISHIFSINWRKCHHSGKTSIQFCPIRNEYLMFVVNKVNQPLGYVGIHPECDLEMKRKETQRQMIFPVYSQVTEFLLETADLPDASNVKHGAA